MMRDAILNFPKQFGWSPKIEGGKLKKYKKFVVAGMGGSHLGAGILEIVRPEMDIIVHSSYGLPNLAEAQWKNRMVIVSSYSGNTEEALDAFAEAGKHDLPRAVISTGGKLLKLAQEQGVPYVIIPATGIQPRCSLGYQLRALAKLMKLADVLKDTRQLKTELVTESLKPQGKALSEKLKGFVPIIYASDRNASLAYNWKIKFNETAKVPAYYNVVPELNHNEINGFDLNDTSKNLAEKFYFIFLKDKEDDPRILRRFEAMDKIYSSRGLQIEHIWLNVPEKNRLFNIFHSLIMADWTALFTAENYSHESEQVPMVEEFKRLIS